MAALDGLLVVDKPGGLTSRAAVDRALRWFPRGTRVGHTGTLDPLATGVLVLCIGQATRLTEYVQQMAKTYDARFLLGARSDTDDLDGVVEPVPGAAAPDRDRVAACLQTFVGEIDQVPPAHSAAKVAGRRAYDLARGGKAVALQPRRVRVHGIELLAYEFPRLDLRVHCGKGTYIRSLARDLGDRLGCGALVETLRRTRVGPFEADRAVSLDADEARARAALLPLSAAVCELPRVTLGDEEIVRLRQGRAIVLAGPCQKGDVAIFDAGKTFLAVARYDPARQMLSPSKVLSG